MKGNAAYRARAKDALTDLVTCKSEFKPAMEMQAYAMELKAFLAGADVHEKMDFLRKAADIIYFQKLHTGRAWLNTVLDITFDLFETSFNPK